MTEEPETYADMINRLSVAERRIESLLGTIKELQIERRVLNQLVKYAIRNDD